MKIGRNPLDCFLLVSFFSRRVGAFDDPKNPPNKRTAEDACPYKGSAKTPLFAFFASFRSPVGSAPSTTR